ncbi:expressed protein [Phakopsora pachyrhizi]|uniref:Expressed protein n=1 Tax=Phakopsora pachyrhizi TaxID=170000 RepID=A0AAV0BEA3_PHAPC|nr:expressed protein [Phakopsora pachyrhizi]
MKKSSRSRPIIGCKVGLFGKNKLLLPALLSLVRASPLTKARPHTSNKRNVEELHSVSSFFGGTPTLIDSNSIQVVTPKSVEPQTPKPFYGDLAAIPLSYIPAKLLSGDLPFPNFNGPNKINPIVVIGSGPTQPDGANLVQSQIISSTPNVPVSTNGPISPPISSSEEVPLFFTAEVQQIPAIKKNDNYPSTSNSSGNPFANQANSPQANQNFQPSATQPSKSSNFPKQNNSFMNPRPVQLPDSTVTLNSSPLSKSNTGEGILKPNATSFINKDQKAQYLNFGNSFPSQYNGALPPDKSIGAGLSSQSKKKKNETDVKDSNALILEQNLISTKDGADQPEDQQSKKTSLNPHEAVSKNNNGVVVLPDPQNSQTVVPSVDASGSSFFIENGNLKGLLNENSTNSDTLSLKPKGSQEISKPNNSSSSELKGKSNPNLDSYGQSALSDGLKNSSALSSQTPDSSSLDSKKDMQNETVMNSTSGSVASLPSLSSVDPTKIFTNSNSQLAESPREINTSDGTKNPSGGIISVAVILAVALPLVTLLIISAYRRKKRI